MRWLFSKLTASRIAVVGAVVVSFFLSIHHRATTLKGAIDTRVSHMTEDLQGLTAHYRRLNPSESTPSPPPAAMPDRLAWVRAQQVALHRQHQQWWYRMGPIDRYDDQRAWTLLHDERRRVNASIDVYNQYIQSPWRAWALSRMGWGPFDRLSMP